MAVSKANRLMSLGKHSARPGRQSDNRNGWLVALRVYLLVSIAAHFLWEIGHLPFYTLWAEGTFAEKAFAVVHCTAGDMIIAIVSLIMAVALIGNGGWPLQRFRPVGALTLFFGVLTRYTVSGLMSSFEKAGRIRT